MPCPVRGRHPEANSFRNFFQADLAVTCTPHRHGQYHTPDPLVIVEILSRSTEDHDRRVKLPVYRSILSVQEILLVQSEFLFVEVHRRLDDSRWQCDLLVEAGDVLRLDSIGVEVPVSALYANVELGPEPSDVEQAP
ncbi:Uma2 family endonuclease [Azospirillum largimobile]